MTERIVLVGDDIGSEQLQRLKEAQPDLEFRYCTTVDSFLATAPEAEIIFTKEFPPEAVALTSKLRWLQAGMAGVEGLLAMGFAARDVTLTNASAAHGVPISEFILGMMLAFATRQNVLIRRPSLQGTLRDYARETKFELNGQILCVVGLGGIGGALARKASALGLRVWGVRRSETPVPGLERQFTGEELLGALPGADHVALCLPKTQETTAIIGERELRAMKPSAYIYNVGRGVSLDANSLLRALSEGWIAGAGLDVTDPEPLPPDSPLWEAPNVILGQHTSGWSPRNAERATDIFLDNLERYMQGRPLRNVIDKTLGY